MQRGWGEGSIKGGRGVVGCRGLLVVGGGGAGIQRGWQEVWGWRGEKNVIRGSLLMLMMTTPPGSQTRK